LAFGGAGFARGPSGEGLFVHGAAPGDRVVARVVARRRGVAECQVDELLHPGPHRVSPPCEVVDRCGGCCWQQVDHGAQLAAKEAIVRHAVGRLGVAVEPITPAPSPYGYRQRVRLRVSPTGLGFAARRSSELVDAERCLLLPAGADALLRALGSTLTTVLQVGDEVAIQLGRGGAVHVLIVPADPVSEPLVAAARGLVGRVVSTVAAARGAFALAPDAGGGPTPVADVADSLGPPWTIAGVGLGGRWYGAAAVDSGEGDGPPLLVAAGSFAQPSAIGAAQLRRLVADWSKPQGARILELFAGAGTLTQGLLGAREVVVVESDARASGLLRRNAAAASPTVPLTVLAEDVRSALPRLVRAAREDHRQRFERVVLDPPRAGCLELLEDLAALGAPRLVYVSCDPMTLARDLARLGQLGYGTTRLRPVDLMPQTFHVEVVALLERGG
jgi:23S rRNA (uracil1939-C5)-methyltransferase